MHAKRLGFVIVVLMLVVPPAWGELLIATAGPMTGPRAWSGEQTRRGAEMAVADLNAAGGILGEPVRLSVADDASDPQQAMAVARKLVDDGVALVVGHRSSDASIAASAVYARAGVLQITPSSTNPQLTEQGIATLFRVCGRDDAQGRVAGDLLASVEDDQRIGIVHDGTRYGRGLAEATRQRLRERGGREVWSGVYDPDRRDFDELLSRLRGAEVDVLFVGGYSVEAGLIVLQAREQGYELQLIGGDSLHNSDYWMIAGDSAEGTLFTFDSDPREHPAAIELVQRFRAVDYEPEGYTLHTYAAIQVWAQAVSDAGSTEGPVVAEAMRARTYDTVLGSLRFDAKGDLVSHSYVWYEWRDGRYLRR